MQTSGLLEVVGRRKKPVLLKRGLSSTLDELLQAADYILKEGNERLILCERVIRTFDSATRFTLDLSAVPWLKLHTHLPVIVDPSHASGDRRLGGPLARGAARGCARRRAVGGAAGARGGGGRRRRDHRRGPPGPRGGTVRRAAGALRARLRG